MDDPDARLVCWGKPATVKEAFLAHKQTSGQRSERTVRDHLRHFAAIDLQPGDQENSIANMGKGLLQMRNVEGFPLHGNSYLLVPVVAQVYFFLIAGRSQSGSTVFDSVPVTDTSDCGNPGGRFAGPGSAAAACAGTT